MTILKIVEMYDFNGRTVWNMKDLKKLCVRKEIEWQRGKDWGKGGLRKSS